MDCEVVEGSGTGMVDEVVGKSCVFVWRGAFGRCVRETGKGMLDYMYVYRGVRHCGGAVWLESSGRPPL